MNRKSYYINQRKHLKYSDGAYVQPGDTVEYNGKSGKIFDFDWLTVNINYDDGSSETNVPVQYVMKTASGIVDKIVKSACWIKN
jgi:hypothetical protein